MTKAIDELALKVPDIWNQAVKDTDGALYPVIIEKFARALIAEYEAAGSEPVAVVDANDDCCWADILPDRDVIIGQKLYARPDPRVSELEAQNAEQHSDSLSLIDQIVHLTKKNAALLEEARRQSEAATNWAGKHQIVTVKNAALLVEIEAKDKALYRIANPLPNEPWYFDIANAALTIPHHRTT